MCKKSKVNILKYLLLKLLKLYTDIIHKYIDAFNQKQKYVNRYTITEISLNFEINYSVLYDHVLTLNFFENGASLVLR